MANPVLQVENLTKRYGDVHAVRGISFEVAEGEVFGLLGPNGAGKTSTIEILEGLRDADGGRVSVCGFDPKTQSGELKREIGAALQSTALPEKLKVIEALDLFAGFYQRRRNKEDLLKRFGLVEKRTAFYGQLSGGQKQRLAMAIALINDPKVVFLDEPTAGLDPQVRREIYDVIEELRRDKKTIVLTTHYIEEAEDMADRIGVINKGEIILVEEKAELMRKLGKKQLTLQLQQKLQALPAELSAFRLTIGEDGSTLIYDYDTKAERTGVATLLGELSRAGLRIRDLQTTQSSLEDIFVGLVSNRQ